MEVEEKVDGELRWTHGPGGGGGGTSETRQIKTFACDQSKDSASVPVAGPGNAVAVGDGSEEIEESGSQCPRLERINTTSVIVSIQASRKTAESSEAGGGADDDAAPAAATETRNDEARSDNQSLTTTAPDSQSSQTAAQRPGKVIVTDVTINSLTVTFKEAMVAEGFFKGY